MKTIVIVGGGAGGLELATKLGDKLGKKQRAKVILVDRSRTHIWKPLLHEVATGSLDTETDGVVYRAHARSHGYEFQLGTMIGIDRDAQRIQLDSIVDEEGVEIVPERQLAYNTLVLAVGSVSNDFGTPGVSQHSYFLDSHRQASKFHQALLNQFLRLNQGDNEATLSLAIVGGGATGVELSAELYHVVGLMRMYGMSGIRKSQLKVMLIEASPRILPALPDRIAQSAREELQRLGVELRESTRITEATAHGFMTAEGDAINADLTVWAAGVKAPPFIQACGAFETNRVGQVLVGPTLQSVNDKAIYVIGDCCGCQQADGSWVPPRAQSAHQMASLVYRNILAQESNKPLQDYVYSDYGSLVNLSKYSTVGSLMGNLTKGSMFVEGRVARFVYISLYRMHQIAIHGWWRGTLSMIARKIGNTIKPKLKLH